MKRLRAAVALLFQLLLLQVSVLGGGMACAPEWLGMVSRASEQAPPAAHDGHAGHAATRHASQHAPESSHRVLHGATAAAPGNAPAPDHGTAPAHCVASAGCAAVAVDAIEVITAPVAIVHGSVQVGRVSLPPSTRAAPEPPPPRA